VESPVADFFAAAFIVAAFALIGAVVAALARI
jgi:hypothetical protein